MINKKMFLVLVLLNTMFAYSMEEKSLMDIETSNLSGENQASDLSDLEIDLLMANAATVYSTLTHLYTFAKNENPQNIKKILVAISKKYGLISVFNLASLNDVLKKGFKAILSDSSLMKEMSKSHKIIELANFNNNLSHAFFDYSCNILAIFRNLIRFVFAREVQSIDKIKFIMQFNQILITLKNFLQVNFIYKMKLENCLNIFLRECFFHDISYLVENPAFSVCWMKALIKSIEPLSDPLFCLVDHMHEPINKKNSEFPPVKLLPTDYFCTSTSVLTDTEQKSVVNELRATIAEHYCCPFLDFCLNLISNLTLTKSSVFNLQNLTINWPKTIERADSKLGKFIAQEKVKLMNFIKKHKLNFLSNINFQ